MEIGSEGDLVTGYIDDTSIMVNGTVEENERLIVLHHKAEAWAKQHASVFAPAKYELVHFLPKKRIRPLPFKLPLAGG
jgi:hypothetical protein